MGFKHVLVMLVIFALVTDLEAWGLRRALRKIGRGIKRVGKAIGKGVKKVGCKVLFGVACPVAVGAAGATLAAGTSGAGAVLVAAGTMAGKHACSVRKDRCKRSAGERLLPFSDDMRDYDMNYDKKISYEEFVFAVMRTVELADPTQLEEPFLYADFDADGFLDTQEFKSAPFLFAHVNFHVYTDSPVPITTASFIDVPENYATSPKMIANTTHDVTANDVTSQSDVQISVESQFSDAFGDIFNVTLTDANDFNFTNINVSSFWDIFGKAVRALN